MENYELIKRAWFEAFGQPIPTFNQKIETLNYIEAAWQKWWNNSASMTIKEAQNKSYPDGGGKYLIDGEYYAVHCDEYHMHSFKCLSKINPSLPTEPKQEDGNFKKFSLLKEPPTIATDSTTTPKSEQQTAESANQILYNNGIDTLELNDEFNTQLFHAMEESATIKTTEAHRWFEEERKRADQATERIKELECIKDDKIKEVIDLRIKLDLARTEAIQECIDKFKSVFLIDPKSENLIPIMQEFKKAFQELEKLKTL